MTGFGRADFGSLGARFDMKGSSAVEARVSATVYDILTVTPSLGVSAGTPGMMKLVYRVSGQMYPEIHFGANQHPSRPPGSAIAGLGMNVSTYGGNSGSFGIVSSEGRAH
ncbi:MAG TPA: hypothetical protein VLA37_07920 [Sphingomonadaceae bacterium]|nr:hypothetical protein [Sphingomonadaceae bacterium]